MSKKLKFEIISRPGALDLGQDAWEVLGIREDGEVVTSSLYLDQPGVLEWLKSEYPRAEVTGAKEAA